MLAQADHGALLRVMNRAYMQRCQEVQSATQQISTLHEQIAVMRNEAAKLSAYKYVTRSLDLHTKTDPYGSLREAFDSLLNQLVSGDPSTSLLRAGTISPNPNGTASRNASHDTGIPSPSVPSIAILRCPEHLRLGHGMMMLLPMDRDNCGELLYWKKKEWENRDKDFRYARSEDDTDKKVPGYCESGAGQGVLISAQMWSDIRVVATSVILGLSRTGQTTKHAKDLSYEAKTYCNIVLGREFPCLRYCEGGRWKIILIISTVYSDLVKSHKPELIKSEVVHTDRLVAIKRDASPSPLNKEPARKKLAVSTGTGMYHFIKRDQQAPLIYILIPKDHHSLIQRRRH